MRIFVLLIAATLHAATVTTCNTGFSADCIADANTNPAALTTDGAWYRTLDSTGMMISGQAHVMVNGAWPLTGPYLPGDTTSQWITTSPDTGMWAPTGAHYFATTFDLTGYDTAITLSGRWMSDNNGTGVWLNGVPITATLPGYEDFGGNWAAFSFSGTANVGMNTLVFALFNGPIGDIPASPASLRVEYTVEAEHLPEPGTLLVVGAALVLFAVTVRRR